MISLWCIFKVLILMKSFLTHLGQIICIDYHEKTLIKSEARFFLLKLFPLITSWSYFNAKCINWCQWRSWEEAFGIICTSLASLTCYSTDFYEFSSIWRPSWKYAKLDNEDTIFQLANIGFWLQHTKIPLLGISKSFLHKMRVPS